MKQKHVVLGLIFLVLAVFLNACNAPRGGISPRQGAPRIAKNEILIEIDTFNIWQNIDGDIVKLNLSQLLGGADFDIDTLYGINKEQAVNLLRMSLKVIGFHTKSIDGKYLKIWM